jgi:sugar O-acyltransferase (sialic acid O-acetyltransferase NeuD family)
MLIIGAKGFAKELLEILKQNEELRSLAFYDDLTGDVETQLFGRFPILNSADQAKHYFSSIDNRFSIGIGNPILRKKLCNKFIRLGGTYTSIISKNAEIGTFDVNIGDGSNVLSGAKISNSVKIGIGGIVYYNSIITHDVIVGEFVEISPGATVLGRAQIGDFSQLGSGSIILPDIKVGKNVQIAAGAVITQNVPDNVMVAGIPAVIKREQKK